MTAEAHMSNASRCRVAAERYARLAESASGEAKRVYAKLQALWLEMTPLAESFDRASDQGVKQRIYEMMGTIEHVRQEVA